MIAATDGVFDNVFDAKIVELVNAVYGHVDSPTIWEYHCNAMLAKAGFEPLLVLFAPEIGAVFTVGGLVTLVRYQLVELITFDKKQRVFRCGRVSLNFL